MGNCSNISNSQTVSLTAGTLTSGFCHTSLQTTYEEFIARTSAAITGDTATFVAGDDTPSSGDQGKLWWKQDSSNCNTPLGWMFYNTTTSAWENAHPVKDDEVTTAKILDNNVTLAKLEHGTEGDVLYYGASGAPARLAKGTAGQHLTMNSGATAPEWTSLTSSPFDFITRVELASGADPTADVAATSIDISSYVSSSASTLGVTPTVAIVELYADITTSVTNNAELLLKVGDDSSMSHYAYVRAHNVDGSRDDAANTASPTNQALVPIGGTAGSEALYYSVDLIDDLGIDRNYKVELVGFCK